MTPNPEVEHIIEQAIKEAAERKHEYVTLEHLLLSLVTYEPFHGQLVEFGIDTDGLISDVMAYVNNLEGMEAGVDEDGA
jgi:ATP-dependent Clp protease ATP-binding subunit ClpA